VVGRAELFHWAIAPLTKLAPFMVRVKAPPPGGRKPGLSEMIEGTGLLPAAVTLKLRTLEIPPPGPGLNTLTPKVPTAETSEAGMATVRRVALTNVVGRLAPFHRASEVFKKFDPLTVSVKAPLPGDVMVGVMLLIVGTGLPAALITKFTALEIPPPGAGLETVTGTVPADAISAAVMEAASWLTVKNVVGRFEPFQRTIDPFMKFDPLTRRVKPAAPAVVDDGFRLAIAGMGFAAAFTVKLTAFDNPPPGAGLNTVTGIVPAMAMSAAEIEAVSCVAETKDVGRSLPFHRTTAPLTKLAPLTVSVNAPPAVIEAGLSEVMLGTGFPATGLIVNTRAFDMPPPGAGLNTVTGTVPGDAMSPAVMEAMS